MKLSFWVGEKFLEIGKYDREIFIHREIYFDINHSGLVGIEPTTSASEADVLPLHYNPLALGEFIPQSGRVWYYTT